MDSDIGRLVECLKEKGPGNGRKQVIVTVKPFGHGPSLDAPGIGNDHGNFHRCVIQIQGESAVSLAEDPMVSHVHTVVRRKDKDGIFPTWIF